MVYAVRTLPTVPLAGGAVLAVVRQGSPIIGLIRGHPRKSPSGAPPANPPRAGGPRGPRARAARDALKAASDEQPLGGGCGGQHPLSWLR